MVLADVFENRSRSRDHRNSMSIPLTNVTDRSDLEESILRGSVFSGPMTSRGLAFIFPKAEEGEYAARDGKSESSHMDIWWGADTDRARSRACHRPQQFKSNLRHDRAS